MNRKAKFLILLFVLLVVGAVVAQVPSCNDTETDRNPVIAGVDASSLKKVRTNPDVDEILLEYEGFTVSFNPTNHMPNWVAWTITREQMEASTLARQDNFRPDPKVPGCATLADYRRSGYDRGHMAPSGDMKWSAEAMDQACLLTNICPQLHALNNGAWKSLEEKCRKNASRDDLLVVVCGPVMTKGFTGYIGETPVPVPPEFFKVVLTPNTASGANAIGFIMPNAYVEGGMQQTAVSVDEVERLTGHDFFYLLPDDIEDRLEAEADFNHFSTGKISRKKRK